MNDERNIDQELSEWFDIQGARIVQTCSARNIPVHLIGDKSQVAPFVLQFIKERADIKNIAYSDSVTLYQTGVVDLAKDFRELGLSVNHPLARAGNGQYVLVVIGRNKIYPDEETALKMVRNRTVQLNCLRHRNKHYMDADLPCLKLGYCASCRVAQCPCMNHVKVDGQCHSKAFADPRIHVCLVNADLGL